MKKVRFLLLTLLTLLLGGVNSAWADNYTVDFNAEIATSDHSFPVASNWKHIVGSNNYDGYGPYYMSYGYSSDGGVDGTGALRVGAQNGYYMGSTQNSNFDFTDGSYDYLITPKVNGDINLQVKRYAVTGYSSYVKIFAVDESGTTVGDEISTTLSSDINESDWVTLSLTLTEEQRLAIRAQAVLIDNFSAESATIEKVPAMTIATISRADSESTTYFDMNADGGYTVQYKVKITNSGEVNLVVGTTENYTLSVSIDGTSYGSFAIPVSVAVGETSEEFVASIELPAGAPTGWKNRYLVENLSGTMNTASLTWSNTIDYNPYPYFIKKGDEPIAKGRSVTAETSIGFGMISEATTLNYEIFANNAGDLQIKSITAPEHFTVTPAETLPYTIAAHTGMFVDVTADGTTTANGNLVITYVDKNGADATVEVALSQTFIDASKWMANFDGGVWPANTVHQSSLSFYTSSYYGCDNAVKASNTYNNKFITPLLSVTANETMTFDAMLDYNYGTVKVYVTKDRASLDEPILSLSSSELNTSGMTGCSFQIKEAGDYYVVFEIYAAMIDNIYGFEKVDVDHDIMVNTYYLNGYTDADQTIQTGSTIKPSFEILPLQAETADAYSVKFYVGEEAVATADAAALTAGTTKKFNFEYTPNVTTTVTYDTYAAIEFTDATVVKSGVSKLTITCEPEFVFFDAGTTVGTTKPSNRSQAISFGVVQESGQVKNFEIFNWGTAALTVKSITVPTGFTASINKATVASKERQAVDITFSATTPDIYSGNLTIVYVDAEGEDQTFTLPISATLLDATLWYVDFGTENNNSGLPAGSLVQSNVSVSTPTTGNAALVSTSSTKNLFITPLMNVTAGDKMTFDAYKRYYSAGTVQVYLIENHIAAAETTTDAEFEALNPTLVQEFSISESSFTAYDFTMPSTGNYYLGFKIANAYVDNIYGLKVADVAHEWILKSSNIPTKATQNTSATATINIANIGIKTEAAGSYTATVYVDEEAVATLQPETAIATVNQLTAAGTQISVPYKYGVAGTFPVYIEVEADGYKVKTETTSVTFAKEEFSSDASAEADGTSTSVPLNLNYYNSESVSLFTPSVLEGSYNLTNGAKIKSITIKGYKTTDTHTSTLNVWYAWVDETSQSKPSDGLYDVTGLTQLVTDKETTWEKKGSTSALEDFIVLDFDEPLVYETGKSLRLVVRSNSTAWKQVYFEKATSASNGLAYYHYNDTKSTFESNSWTSSVLPVLHIELDATLAALTGTVTDGANPVEGATVTLTSEDADKVQYTGTTDAEGKYSIDVIQATRTYTVTASKEGASATVEGVNDFSQAVNLTIKALDEIEIGDDALPTDVAATANVTITRSLKAGWNAIVLPITLTATEVSDAFGENAEVAAYDGDEGTGSVTVNFSKVTKIVAGTPYLLYLESAPSKELRFLNKTITKEVKTVKGQTFSFTGVYETTDINTGDYFLTGGNLKRATTNNKVLPFRSYLQLNNKGDEARGIRFFVDGEEIDATATGIETLKQQVAAEGIYTLSGQKVDRLQKGLNIVNGKKIFVK